MKCHVCEQKGLSWWRKALMAISVPMKCSHCDARYHLSLFKSPLTRHESGCYAALMELITPIIFLGLLVLFFWLIKYFTWPLVLLLLLLAWMVLALLVPHRINHKDPINEVVQRIQNKKSKPASSNPNSEP